MITWEPLIKITEKITDGVHQTPSYTKSGIPFLSATHIKNGKIVSQGCNFISNEDYQTQFKNKVLQPGDILLAKSGTLATEALFNFDTSFAFYESLALIRANKKLVSPNYLHQVLNFLGAKFINSFQKGMGV